MKANEVRLSLTDEQVIHLLAKLGATNYIETPSAVIFPTLCHNINIEEASMKLYYYRNSKLFQCYTECGDCFDIFELYRRYWGLRGVDKPFYSILSDIMNDSGIEEEGFEFFHYEKQKKYLKRKLIELPEYPAGVLDTFSKTYCEEWLREGITPKTMDKFNIRYSIRQNKIIIPHYDVSGRLVGIRGRALNPEEASQGKYRPVYVEGKQYNHPLSLNLYGLNWTKEDINYYETVIIFEAEKSVMLMDSYFPKNNSVAVCGSNLNKNQLLILLHNCKVKNVILAFDKEYEKIGTPECEKYLNKIRAIGEKYSKYYQFYYIADREGLLAHKDSPIDKGPEIFQRLMEKKVVIRG